ncbi:universal stress protein [Frigidibacter sp. SD6-1]|uniref:universal stress protein n=1 Tax=Frigidibacter sp. SD6-1 TaxID=3032581 RepID=UPI0024DFFCF7|nr:universal stress protein [Frigidibacter sp. SD6-1]
MAYKSILTVVTAAKSAAAQIDAAVALARREDAHLDVLCLSIDRTQSGYYYIGAAPMAPIVLQETLQQAENEAKAIEAAVRAQLAPEDIRWAVDTAIAQMGAVGPEVGRLARFADLVVVPQPYGAGSDAEQEQILEAALFDGRAAVLMLPPGRVDADYGRRVVVAWNQSDQSMAAVRAALPVLKAASFVDVAVIAPPAHGPERSDPGGMLSQFLSRHGIRSEVSVLAKTLPHVSDQLCRHIEDVNADLLVMGAYGHSRFREAILGGTTLEMLEKAKVPVLTAH